MEYLYNDKFPGCRIKIAPDDFADLDNLFGDTYDPSVNTDIDPAVLAEQKQEEIDRINRDGVWGMIAEYECSCCGRWTEADSVWGFIGDDWKGSGYEADLFNNANKERNKK